MTRGRHIAVIGAGAFGGWTALMCRRMGAIVTLVDAWGPGNSRASSGGETRVIRHVYDVPLYVGLAQTALRLWLENQQRWNKYLFVRSGALFMVGRPDFFATACKHMTEAGVEFDVGNATDLQRQHPQINPEGIDDIIFDHQAGYLMARESCAAVVDAFVSEGGEYLPGQVTPGPQTGRDMKSVRLSDGKVVKADIFVFACGPWLGKIFPEVFRDLIRVTRQEVYFFGPPADSQGMQLEALPVWADVGDRFWYGVPAAARRGFKIADDSNGPEFDPTGGSRVAKQSSINAARQYLGYRFPAMKDAPLVESRVCQYSMTPDSHFVVDRLPGSDNVWIAGGGSGHGFKHGPAIGEMLAAAIIDAGPLPDEFSLTSRCSGLAMT